MKEFEIEHLLRHVRPVGPPTSLRHRLLSSSRVVCLWPWLAGVAAASISTILILRVLIVEIAGLESKLNPNHSVQIVDVVDTEGLSDQRTEFLLFEQTRGGTQPLGLSRSASFRTRDREDPSSG
jgi:hypothetical protein